MIRQKQTGFGHLVLLLVVLIIAVVGFAGWQVYKKHGGAQHPSYNQSGRSYGGGVGQAWNSPQYNEILEAQNLPGCKGTELFSSPVADLSTFSYIDPLGNTSSYSGNAGHVVPVDHMYFNFNHVRSSDLASPSLPATVLSPGNVEIYQVRSVTYIKDGATTGHDYTLFMAPCKEVTVYLGHINTISQTIQNAVDQATGDNKYCLPDNNMGGTIFRQCNYAVLLNLKSGDQIGTAGGPGVNTMAFDFGVYDNRNKPLAFVDQKYWTPQNLHTVCGLSYYPPGTVRSAQFQKVKNTKSTNGLPDCGTNMWDKTGTLQGNWVLPNTPTGAVPDQQSIVFVPYNNDPSQVDVDWGGTIAPADRINAPMMSSGEINRDPSQVTADGKVYCYSGSTYSGRILVQLVNSTTLKAERQSGSCAAGLSLSSPTTYVR